MPYLEALLEVLVLLKEGSIVYNYLKSHINISLPLPSYQYFIPEHWQCEVQVFGHTRA